MMVLIRDVSAVIGCLVSLGTLVCVSLPSIRKKLVSVLTRRESENERLEQIFGILETLSQGEKERKEEQRIQQEVDLCVLRDLITGVYYKYAKEKKIPVYAMENVSQLYTLYRKRGGNSYVKTLFRQMAEEWDVIS